MRADMYVFSQGAAKSRKQAKDLIESESVLIDGKTVKKASENIDENVPHDISVTKKEKFVSRGGLKLEAAIEAFSIDVKNANALDIGASTGGFTDCLLFYGAKKCVAVDSGQGQLDPSLENDSRVVSYEKYNARELTREIIPEGADIVVMDVSFISQTLIIGNIPSVLNDGGAFVSLIKPQFEAGRGAIGKGGIVRSASDREAAVFRVIDFAQSVGLVCCGLIQSPIKGGDGNTEFLALFKKLGNAISREDIKKTVRERSKL